MKDRRIEQVRRSFSMVHRSACAGFQAEAGYGQHDEQGACRSPLPDQYDGPPAVYLKKALQADKMVMWKRH